MERYHFIGIGGIGMSSLASILLSRNIPVSGSDLSLNERTTFLKSLGAQIFEGHSPDYVEKSSTAVFHSRIPLDHPELKKSEIKIHRVDLLKKTIGTCPILTVVGAHGKTSTSSLLAHVLTSHDPTWGFSVGGVLKNSNLNGKDGTKGFVVEGDESDASFLRLHPQGAILTNVDPDHLDFWGDFERLKGAYTEFLATIKNPELFFFAKDEDHGLVGRGVSYGIEKGDIQAFNLKLFKDGTEFSIYDRRDGFQLDYLYIPLIGIHQVKNAVAVFAMARSLGVPHELIQQAFSTFQGVKRRLERMKPFMGLPTFLDYGHHPKELSVTFQGLKRQYEKKLIVIFEPHKFTRTKIFFSDFVEALKIADSLILLDTYAAMEPYDFEGSSEKLAESLKIQVTSREELSEKIRVLVKPDSILLFIGAGTIDQVCHECLMSSV
ncbi:MAG: UDP-N-acetylmuramate--L-alanine ligase [Chlamydiae bacterium]|nr:UDP-N-acetylmuramate--L-alanine ligase [Chlamydiota bacterium]